MQQKPYSKKLKDPRWQKKRLQIFDRDKWCCQVCDDDTSTLNVHHLEYQKGLEPWEYKDEELITVCEYHHAIISLSRIPKFIILAWLRGKLNFKKILPLDKYLRSEKLGELFKDYVLGIADKLKSEKVGGK